MKYFIFIILLTRALFSEVIDCTVSKEIVSTVKPLFSDVIAYNKKLQVTIQSVVDGREALMQLKNNKKAKFAIVRRDILWQIEQSDSPLKHSYILISELPFSAVLYLIQDIDCSDTDLDLLEKKKVSIGSLGGGTNIYLKALLDKKNIKHNVLYKSLTYEDSMNALLSGDIDAYFGFLLSSSESSTLHFQTLFSAKTVEYFKDKNIFEIDYNGIASPYVLVANMSVNDEEMKSIIYRLMEEDLFIPMTDERYGIMNRYLLKYLEEVKKVLKHRKKNYDGEIILGDDRTKMCRKYHYGFLKLLRQKPTWKKKLKCLGNPEKQRKLLKSFNQILLDIDAKKDTCDLKFLKVQKIKFNKMKREINYTAKH